MSELFAEFPPRDERSEKKKKIKMREDVFDLSTLAPEESRVLLDDAKEEIKKQRHPTGKQSLPFVYDPKLRAKFIEMVDNEKGQNEIAREFGIHPVTLGDYVENTTSLLPTYGGRVMLVDALDELEKEGYFDAWERGELNEPEEESAPQESGPAYPEPKDGFERIKELLESNMKEGGDGKALLPLMHVYFGQEQGRQIDTVVVEFVSLFTTRDNSKGYRIATEAGNRYREEVVKMLEQLVEDLKAGKERKFAAALRSHQVKKLVIACAGGKYAKSKKQSMLLAQLAELQGEVVAEYEFK